MNTQISALDPNSFTFFDNDLGIPFNKLSDVKEIGKGEFGSVYSATWLDGIRKLMMMTIVTAMIKTRAYEPSSTIALKTLTILHGNKLSNVKEIGKGGFGSVYLATWLNGI
ncbi:hypothetical protein C2G38_2171927 [Gigaspora rosea]|uniref:Protein kinase domain-containing protein n=1 Tax=Gigaspora rosea TaxID=44941 RepID=A0A397VQD0_9GLOM|nr:hypothetical protein C2G38_2171927 [Gigaspora rosea]